MMQVQKYKLGEYVFKHLDGQWYQCSFLSGVIKMTQDELFKAGATPLIESESEMLEEDPELISKYLFGHIVVEGVEWKTCWMMSQQNKAINALKKGTDEK